MDELLGRRAPQSLEAEQAVLGSMLELGAASHDGESYVITFASAPTAWADKTLTLRKYPTK